MSKTMDRWVKAFELQHPHQFNLNVVCDVCHKGPQACTVHGDIRSSDGVLMDRFVCKTCFKL